MNGPLLGSALVPIAFLFAFALPLPGQEEPAEAPEDAWGEEVRRIEKERRVGIDYDELEFRDGLFVRKGVPYTGAAHSLAKKTRRVKMMLNFKEGKWHGEVREFHENGQPYSLAHYKSGVQDGINVYWDENGKKVKTRLWKNGEVVSETDEEETESSGEGNP